MVKKNMNEGNKGTEKNQRKNIEIQQEPKTSDKIIKIRFK